jgi:alpha/beta superfamily hydrolase
MTRACPSHNSPSFELPDLDIFPQHHDRVLQSLIQSLHKLHYHVLKFNSRGVGESTGWPSFTGLSEAKDLQNVVTWALQTVSDVHSLVIIVSVIVTIQYNRLIYISPRDTLMAL